MTLVGNVRSKFGRRMNGLLIGLAIVAVGSTAVYLFGQVEGIEFSPNEFRYRNFQYVQIPWIRVQVWPIVRSDSSPGLSDYLHGEKQILPTSISQPGRWDLVRISRNGRVGRGDADLLYRALARRDESGSFFWLKWTQSNESSARRLWPEVQRLAERELYFLIPELMELATSQADPERLPVVLDDHLARVLELHASTQQELGNARNALELLDEALRHVEADSSHAQALQARRRQVAPAQAEAGN